MEKIKTLTERERFDMKTRVNPKTGCWDWVATQTIGGYGRFSIRGKPGSAHVASYLIYNGEIPAGLLVRHTCDNAACVNPDHLILGTHADNMQDARSRGRFNGMNAKLTNEQVLGIFNEPGRHHFIAAKWGVSTTTVSHIKTGRHWGYLTEKVVEPNKFCRARKIFDEETVHAIRRAEGSLTSIGKTFGLAIETVSQIRRRVTWASIPEEKE